MKNVDPLKGISQKSIHLNVRHFWPVDTENANVFAV
jgi:hypothetical protein